MDNILNPPFLVLAIKFKTLCVFVVIIISLFPYVFSFVMLKKSFLLKKNSRIFVILFLFKSLIHKKIYFVVRK